MKADENRDFTVTQSFASTLPTRALIRIEGADRYDFLNNVVTQSVKPDMPELVAAALLTPQGKLLDEFLIKHETDALLIDCAASRRDALIQRLSMYKLRSDVQIEPIPMNVIVHWGLIDASTGLLDPRHRDLGTRHYTQSAGGADDHLEMLWHEHRLCLGITEGPEEMTPGEEFPLEFGLHLTHAIEFHKGCFIGQEVTSRSYRRGSLRKGIYPCKFSGPCNIGDAVLADGAVVGRLIARFAQTALILLRHDACEKALEINDHRLDILSGLFIDR